MISPTECVRRIAERFPEFSSAESGLVLRFIEFAGFAVERIGSGADARAIFETIESLMTDGDEEVSTAAATGFLESILHAASAGRVDPARFVGLLGERSRAYGREWDRFTGVDTPGL